MSSSIIISRADLDALLRQKCRLTTVRDFQLTHGLDLVNGRDVFLVIAPGMGKTTVLCAPLLAAQAALQAGIAIAVVPSKILAEQLVCMLHTCLVPTRLTQ